MKCSERKGAQVVIILAKKALLKKIKGVEVKKSGKIPKNT
jgi:hypothetical protein